MKRIINVALSRWFVPLTPFFLPVRAALNTCESARVLCTTTAWHVYVRAHLDWWTVVGGVRILKSVVARWESAPVKGLAIEWTSHRNQHNWQQNAHILLCMPSYLSANLCYFHHSWSKPLPSPPCGVVLFLWFYFYDNNSRIKGNYSHIQSPQSYTASDGDSAGKGAVKTHKRSKKHIYW